jgi:hypothetical protein
MRFASVLLAFTFSIAALGAQSQPKGVAFDASGDHHTGLVDGYRIYLLRDGQPLRTREFVKTAPDHRGTILYADPALFDGLDAGTYEVGVTAFGPGGESEITGTAAFNVGSTPDDWPAPPPTAPPTKPSAPSTPQTAGACTTIKPGPDWTCYAGGWLPPGMPLPGSAPPPPPPPPPAVPVSSTNCPTTWPGAGWTCLNGAWYPPGHPMISGAVAAPVAAPPAPTGSVPCVTVRPGPLWTCVDGGWLPPGAAPVDGSALVVHVEAEAFDQGGQGQSYYDSSPGNTGGAHRPSDVDIEVAKDSGGGFNVAWITAGEWLNFTVTVPVSGSYELAIRVASKGPGGAFHIEVDGVDRTGLLAIPNTGGWQVWTTVRTRVQLQAGTQVWRFVADTQSIDHVAVGNLNWIRATPR